MFEYAYARALSLEYGEPLVINPYFMTLAGFGAGRKMYFNNVLPLLNIPDDIRILGKVSGLTLGMPDIAEFVMMRKKQNGSQLHGIQNFHRLNERGKYCTDDCFTFYESVRSGKTHKKVIGYYQSEKYFEKYKDVIKKELKVTKEPSKQNQDMLEKICSCNAVCVHIRRGDYISNSKNKALVVCDEQYYQRGMRCIAEQVCNPVFFVFSDNNDEIEWIRRNYHFESDVQYVTLNNPDYEELRLMYHCKHFVIANSTFSWWGAYLADNEGKIIVAPAIWNKEYTNQIDIYLEDMIRL